MIRSDSAKGKGPLRKSSAFLTVGPCAKFCGKAMKRFPMGDCEMYNTDVLLEYLTRSLRPSDLATHLSKSIGSNDQAAFSGSEMPQTFGALVSLRRT